MSLLAQATTDLVEQVATPSVDWWGVMPVLILAALAMVLLYLSLVKRFFTGSSPPTRSWSPWWRRAGPGLWWRVTDDVPGRGPFSTLGGAYGRLPRHFHRGHLPSVVLTAPRWPTAICGEGLRGAVYSLTLLSASGGVIMASANDLIVLFLGLEILSLAVYVLAAMHMRRFTSQEAGMEST